MNKLQDRQAIEEEAKYQYEEALPKALMSIFGVHEDKESKKQTIKEAVRLELDGYSGFVKGMMGARDELMRLFLWSKKYDQRPWGKELRDRMEKLAYCNKRLPTSE